ncbi:curli-like amyloid fiber formation chaperone CsgH [Tianweitania sediminis]|uniref:Uncharacterized protein n=1 Tax=Tianweitania sediminis TaxID=1502156 RepID=A0A8J7RPZ9_9HYPH|nr:curli-like amyloid fiber formation chaperone CsgH [Tianweitania sediminis]MBP0441051.1 hypothetical protein [Tianweitania sediminis]
MRGLRFLPVVLAMVSASPAYAQSAAAVATVEASATEGGVRLVGRAVALADGRYEAKMAIRKSGRSGETSTTQGGAFELQAGKTADVASVGLSMVPGDTLVVDLVLTAGGEEVSRTMLSVGK